MQVQPNGSLKDSWLAVSPGPAGVQTHEAAKATGRHFTTYEQLAEAITYY